MSRISNSLTTVLRNLLTMMFWDECLYVSSTGTDGGFVCTTKGTGTVVI